MEKKLFIATIFLCLVSCVKNEENSEYSAIKFESEIVKMVCCEKYDFNGDGELSYKEASEVLELEATAFFGSYQNQVQSFNELKYFTSLKKIPNEAFNNCLNLKSIGLPESLMVFTRFYNCPKLTAFSGKFASNDKRCWIVDGILVLIADADLTEYKIPNNVITIGDYIFYDNNAIVNVTIPNSVTSIGKSVLYSCANLTHIYCTAINPPKGGYKMFEKSAKDRKIYVPMSSVDAYKSAEYWDKYVDYIVGY